MKILMTADTMGGVWTYAMELCRGLHTYGAEITLATMGRPLSARQHAEVAPLAHVELCESRYRLCWMPEPWDDMERATAWLLDLEARVRPDIVHLNDLGHGGIAWRAPVVLVVHSCVLSWWQAVKGEPAPKQDWQRYRQTVYAACRRADRIITPSGAMLSAFMAHYGEPKAAQVIYNGRSLPTLTDTRPADKQPFFFSAGRLWDEGKNIALLASIAPSLTWPVFIAGEPQAEGNESHLAGAIQHLGDLDMNELSFWLREAAIFVMPARYEPFGLSILEAALAGCALVLGDIPSLREIWGTAARYVNPNNADQLLHVLTELTDNHTLREYLGQRARQRALRYTTERMAHHYWRRYQQLQHEAQSVTT